MVDLAASAASAIMAGFLAAYLMSRRRRRAHAARHAQRRAPVPGLDVSLAQFWGAVTLAGGFTFLLVFAVTGLAFVSVVPAVVVATLPKAYFTRKRMVRQAAVQEAWPDGLRDILSSIRSGASLPRAVENMATFGPAPLREAFQGFSVYARSLGVIPALEMVKDDLADPTSDRIIEVLILAHERGGGAVPGILSDLAEAVTRDIWTMEQLRTESLEQKINSRVVFVLPWVVLVAITARPGPFREFYGTPAGIGVVVVGGLLSLAGILLASRLGATPDEPRVFGGSA